MIQLFIYWLRTFNIFIKDILDGFLALIYFGILRYCSWRLYIMRDTVLDAIDCCHIGIYASGVWKNVSLCTGICSCLVGQIFCFIIFISSSVRKKTCDCCLIGKLLHWQVKPLCVQCITCFWILETDFQKGDSWGGICNLQEEKRGVLLGSA